MPDPAEGQPDAALQESNQKKLEAIFAEHPGFGGGQLSSRDGTPYNPVNLPNDPSAERFYQKTAGQPEQPPAVSRAEPVKETPSVPEPAAQPVTRLLAGKYANPEELERGYHQLLEESQKRSQENIALKAVNQHFETLAQTLRSNREEPARPQHIRGEYDADGKPVISADQIDEIVVARATEAAREQVQRYLEPLSKMGKAASSLRAAFPDYSKSEAEFSTWLAVNQQYSDRIAADPEFAMEAAYLKFNHERGAQRSAATTEVTRAAQAQIDESKRAAASPGGTPGGARRATSADGRDAKIGQLIDHWQRTGDNKPLARFRLEEALGTEFLDSLDKTTWGR